MKYYNAEFCVNCDVLLSRSDIMSSNGRCRACGVKGEGAVTIVETYSKAFHYIKPEHKWWNIIGYFIRKRVYGKVIGKNDKLEK